MRPLADACMLVRPTDEPQGDAPLPVTVLDCTVHRERGREPTGAAPTSDLEQKRASAEALARRWFIPRLTPTILLMSFSIRALLLATSGGTLLQLLMIWRGHTDPAVAKLFPVGGMGISLLAGVAYVALCEPALRPSALVWAASAGGICAFIGILASYLLKDVPASLLALGTISSTVTGLLGGWIGRRLF